MESEGLNYRHRHSLSFEAALPVPKFFPRRFILATVFLTYKILAVLS